MTINEIMNENNKFLNGKPRVYFSPGRVNLIGEHIDYLGGNVFPTGINLGTYAFVTSRDDHEFHFLSHNFKEFGKKVVSLDFLDFDENRDWANYPSGVLQSMIKKGLDVDKGLNILIYGTLPNGAGLSSSASLEVLMGTLLKNEYNFDISTIDIVKLSQKVENNYIGVNCGIMDQFAVGMCKKDYAIYLDTNSLEYQLVPLILGDYTLIIANTNKKRALADSKYNQRRSECDIGLKVLKNNNIDINMLCDMDPKTYESAKYLLTDNTIKRRVEHAVYENDRTKKAVTALEAGNLELLGKLMNLSHISLKNLYKVSCLELDTLVDSFLKHGAIGSRMTGAGFGGCTISLVKTNIVKEVIKNVGKEYIKKIGHTADFYLCKTSDGARKLSEEEIK